MARRGADLEILDFTAAPAGEGLAIVEVRARLLAGREPRFFSPRLLVGDGSARPEALPAADARREPGIEGAWRLRFACPLEALGARELGLSLSPGLVFDLPRPDDADGPGADGFAALATEAGELRRAAAEAECERDEAVARAEAAERVRAELEAQLAHERERADSNAAKLAAAQEALSIARGEHEAAIAERERELAALRERELELSRRAEAAPAPPPAQPTRPLAPVEPAPEGGGEDPTEPFLARGPLTARHVDAQWRARATALAALLLVFVIVVIVLATGH